jgi:L-alanine-DL-glutamate epimerase-like enolase superfamily enzyme
VEHHPRFDEGRGGELLAPPPELTPVRPEVKLEGLTAAAYRIPTQSVESDGTFTWDSTTLVAVHARAGGMTGFGYTYSAAATAGVVLELLAPKLKGVDALAVEQAWELMGHAVRNVGREGVAASAISAVDCALWDLKGRLLELPLTALLGAVRPSVEVYGSGGFTNWSVERTRAQLEGWLAKGIKRVKLKVGSNPENDVARVHDARLHIGDAVKLMVDANGAWTAAESLELATTFSQSGVSWLEEPVTSDDLPGLAHVRTRAPVGLEIAAGEYGYTPDYFRRMLEAQAVDVLQADATRCLGITGFLAVARLCEAFHVPLSAHTAPSLHARVGCAAGPLVHVEYFHDHALIEGALFDGFVEPADGRIAPDPVRPGLGLELKERDAACDRVA